MKLLSSPIQILVIGTFATIIFYYLYQFLKDAWTVKEKKNLSSFKNDYDRDYERIMTGIQGSKTTNHLKVYEDMIERFHEKYKGTKHELDANSDKNILMDIWRGKQYFITGGCRPIFTN